MKVKILINVNDKTRVLLTDAGKRVIDKLDGEAYDSEGFIELPLWQIFKLFIDNIYMGSIEQPFYSNTIEVSEYK